MQNLLYQALAAQFGIVVSSSDRELDRQRLYKARADAMDTELEVLQVRIAPDDPNHLWIVKGNAKKT